MQNFQGYLYNDQKSEKSSYTFFHWITTFFLKLTDCWAKTFESFKLRITLKKQSPFLEYMYVVRRHHVHRLHLPAHAAGKICTVVNFGLPTAESGQLSWGQLLVNLYVSLKLIFMTLSPSMYLISMMW